LRATSRAIAKEVARVEDCWEFENSGDDGDISGTDATETGESGVTVVVGEDMGLKSRRSLSRSLMTLEAENERL
jgi:hypothetical protein